MLLSTAMCRSTHSPHSEAGRQVDKQTPSHPIVLLPARLGKFRCRLRVSELLLEGLADTGTLIAAGRDRLAPLGDMVLGVFGHAAGQPGHEPRVTVPDGVLSHKLVVVGKGKLVVAVHVQQGQTAVGRLHAQGIVQDDALFTRNAVAVGGAFCEWKCACA